MDSFEVVIIGSGFSGLCAGIKLKEKGEHNFLILEKEADIGGTWRDNTYPGAACDIRAMFYSFSFFINKNWSREYPQQPEIHAYLKDCVKHFKLEPHIRTRAEVAKVQYEESSKTWLITNSDQSKVRAKYILSGTGQLHLPHIPQISGSESFSGHSFHTARWNHKVSLYNKKVVIVGNGASAIQVVPAIVPKVKKLTVLQRSANWIIPRWDRPYTLIEKLSFRFLPFIPEITRFGIWLRKELLLPALNSDQKSPVRAFFETLVRWYLQLEIKDAKLRKILTPDYPVGCKRVLISDDYYASLNRQNADVIEDSIQEINVAGIKLKSGEQLDADVIIYATGFRSNDFLYPIEVFGREELHINEAWRHGAEAYLGMCVPGFPNFFMLYGPNTNLGHNSIVFMIENQVEYILNIISKMKKENRETVEVKNDVMADWSEECQHSLSSSVWAQGCDSWYKNESGKIVNNWPYSTVEYWLRTMNVNFDHFLIDEKQPLYAKEQISKVS